MSSDEDRGILVKALKNKVSLSFWGDDDDMPKKIVFGYEDIRELGEHLLGVVSPQKDGGVEDHIENFLEEMKQKNANFEPEKYK